MDGERSRRSARPPVDRTLAVAAGQTPASMDREARPRDPRTGHFLPGQCESGNRFLRFRPGEDGRPAIRPRGTRKRLHDLVVGDLYEDWYRDGPKLIHQVRAEAPLGYLRAVIALLPKQIKVEHSNEMTKDELRQRIRQLAIKLGFMFGGAAGAPGSPESQRSDGDPGAPGGEQPPRLLPPVPEAE
jgi:hypothetical protein